jgi:hypothetical protein
MAVPPASSAPAGSVRGDQAKSDEDRRNRHEEGIRSEGRHGRGGVGDAAATADPGGAGGAGRGGEGGAARAQRRCRPGCRARVDGGRRLRGRRSEGQAQLRQGREASRSRGRVDDLGRPARAGASPADAHGQRRARAAGRDVRVLRRSRPADAGGDGSDARRRLDQEVRASRRARRHRGRGVVVGDEQVDGLGAVHRAHPAPRWGS